MSIIGAGDVEAATGTLTIAAGDVVTPLARERAAALGVEIVLSGGSGAAVAKAPATWKAPTPVSSATTRSAGGTGRRPSPASTTEATRPWAKGAPVRSRPEALTGPLRAAELASAPRTASADTLNTLYRRGAPVSATLSPAGAARTGGGNRPRVAVVGAGHVGSIATLRLAESDLFDEVVLLDVVDGLAAGVALDLWHGAGLSRFATTIRGASETTALTAMDYVVITAGRARKPGMTRTDLTQVNADIVGPLAEAVAQYSPNAVIVVVTNPLEEMTHLAQLRSGFPPERVVGMAGVLDSARFQALVALEAGLRPDEVDAVALGSHGPEMVIPLSQASVHGRPLTDVVDAGKLEAIVDRARNSGAEVVSLLKTGSAYFAPGQSAARMVVAMASGSPEIMACAVVPNGEYGLQETRVGLPVRLGAGGVAQIVELDLTADERTALRAAADSLGERIREVS